MKHENQNDNAWQYLKEIGVGERHFNEIESKYRALASTWILGSFAGMGFAATSTGLPVRSEIIIFAISLAGTFGVQLLWVVDLLAYHHLLAAYYLEGLKIEATHSHLPQIGWNIWKQGIVEMRVKLFYAGCSVALLPFGLGALLCNRNLTEPTAFVGIMLVLGAICGSTVLWKKSTNAWLYTEVDKIKDTLSTSVDAGNP